MSAVVDVEPGAPQRRAERAQDLRLVVDDQDPLLHAGSSAVTSTTGRASAKVAPWPGLDSAQTRPPFAAANPRAIARPKPGARALVAVPAIERLEDSLELARVEPRPLVDDPNDRLLPGGGDAHVNPSGGRRELQRVLEQVRENALNLDRVDAHERSLAGDVDAIVSGQVADGFPNQVVERPHLHLGLGAARFEPREVEQVADEAPEPLGVHGDRVQEHPAVVVAEDECLAAERSDRRRDPRERRAQVVRDRAQQRRLHEVAAPQRLGLERLLLEAAAVERHGEQRCERRKEPVAHPEIGVGVGRHVERADGSAVDLERDRGVRCMPPTRAELDLGARDAEHARRLNPHPAQLAVQGLPAEQVPGDLGEQGRLPLALLGIRRPPPRPARQLADDERRHGVHGQRKPVRRVAQRERVRRRQEEEVEGEHARDGHRQRPVGAPGNRHGQHREDVEDAEADRRREGLERPDEQRGDGHGGDGARELHDHAETVAPQTRASAGRPAQIPLRRRQSRHLRSL